MGFPIPNTVEGVIAMAVYLLAILLTRPLLRIIFGFTLTTAIASPAIMLLLTVGYVILSYVKIDRAKPPE